MGRGQKCPYSCLDSFLPLLVFRVLFFTKSIEVCRKPLLFFLSWSCNFCPGIDPTISVSADVFSHVCRAVWHWSLAIIYAIAISSIAGLSPVLGIISFLKIAHFNYQQMVEVFPHSYSYWVELDRFLQSFTKVTVVPGWKPLYYQGILNTSALPCFPLILVAIFVNTLSWKWTLLCYFIREGVFK